MIIRQRALLAQRPKRRCNVSSWVMLGPRALYINHRSETRNLPAAHCSRHDESLPQTLEMETSSRISPTRLSAPPGPESDASPPIPAFSTNSRSSSSIVPTLHLETLTSSSTTTGFNGRPARPAVETLTASEAVPRGLVIPMVADCPAHSSSLPVPELR